MRTQVSKQVPAIKRILQALGTWRGWLVYVDDDPSWSYRFARDAAEPVFVRVDVVTPVARQIQPHLAGTVIDPPAYGEVVVEKETAAVPGSVWHGGSVVIHVPPIDRADLAVARDELLQLHGTKLRRNDPRTARIKLLLEAFGPYAGIVRAVLDSQVATLAEAQAKHPPSERRGRQLDREIAAFMHARKKR